MTSLKLNNSTVTCTNDTEMYVISNKFLKINVKMINEIKEDTNKCLNEFQETSNKEFSEIKKMQDMKDEFIKDTEILKIITLLF
jgi:hypothetical protein